MAHVRTQIRDAVVAALAGLSTTEDRVYSGRSRPKEKDAEPFLLVYCTEERSEVTAMGADPILDRVLTLAVEGCCVAQDYEGAQEVEERLDQIALEVEPAITEDSSLGGLAIEVTLTGARIAVQAPGERHAGNIRMEFRVHYRTRESAPGTAV